MTESEAKQKICPVFSITARAMMAGSLNPENAEAQATAMQNASMCIGNKCMMWREIKHQQDYPTFKGTFTGEEMFTQQVDIIDYGGFCGLAGK